MNYFSFLLGCIKGEYALDSANWNITNSYATDNRLWYKSGSVPEAS